MAEIITNHDAQYAYDIVKTICTEVGPGLPGSTQERERAAIIKRKLESHLGAGNVVLEEFAVAPWAYLSSFPISALFMLIAALLNLFMERFPEVSPRLTAASSLVVSLVAPLPFILGFVLNLELFDRFFPKRPSVNVIGTLRKSGTFNAKRLLILSGHHDSAPENTWLRFFGYGFILLTAAWMFSFFTMPVMSTIQLVGVITGNINLIRTGTLGWGLLAFPIVPAILYGLFFNRGRQNGGNVPGAVDNLSGSAITVAMCRFLVENPSFIPEDTEIRFVTFGSEEAGLRGSRRYVERHLNELKRMDARLLNIETVAQPEIGILTSEVNGTVKIAPEMVKSVVAAAQRAGVPYKVYSAYLGAGSDAGPFSRAGIKATTLLPFKLPQHMVAFYHSRRDTLEMLAIEPLLNVLKLTLEWVRCGGDD